MSFSLILLIIIANLEILMCNEWNMQLIQQHNHDNYYKFTNIKQHKIKKTNQNYALYDCTHSKEGRNLNLKYYTQVYLMHMSATQKFCNYDKFAKNHQLLSTKIPLLSIITM